MAGREEDSRGEEAGVEESWGEAEFRGVDLGDKRLAQRLQKLADDFSTQPQAPINQASADWAATKAAYRFFENPHASAKKIFAAHRLRTSQRIEGQQVVLAIQDTTYLNYSHHPQTTGLGPVGDSRSDAQGLILHSTLVVTPAGLPLLTPELWARSGYKPQSVRERKHTAIEEKESYRWVAALQETVARVPTTTTVVTICDREADIYELLAAAQRVAAAFVIRAAWDRHIEHEDYPRLWPLVESQAVAGEITLEPPARAHRGPRSARLAVRFTVVTVDPPRRLRAAVPGPLHALTLYAVQVKEAAPPSGEEAIEWMPLTTLPVHTFSDARQRVDWYRRRWQGEEFHKILKSGCRVEACRLQTAQRLQRYIALCTVIAWRLYWLTYSNRTTPTAPATTILSPEEANVLHVLTHGAFASFDSNLSVRDALRLIAKLGGFLGRRRDGEPGITTLWRGWQRLSDLTLMWSLMTEGKLVVIARALPEVDEFLESVISSADFWERRRRVRRMPNEF